MHVDRRPSSRVDIRAQDHRQHHIRPQALDSLYVLPVGNSVNPSSAGRAQQWPIWLLLDLNESIPGRMG